MLKTTSLQELYFENLYISPSVDLYLRALHNKHSLVSVFSKSVSATFSVLSSFTLLLLLLVLLLPLLIPFPISLFLWPRSFRCCCQRLRVLTGGKDLSFLHHLQAGWVFVSRASQGNKDFVFVGTWQTILVTLNCSQRICKSLVSSSLAKPLDFDGTHPSPHRIFLVFGILLLY